ncbi:MAG: class I tRNA ligase family protein [Candidatus Colwellbacteria bacterium]|jgi:leucyl-tRNA synthetase|nr:leucine--tRNA ligase [Candidatus Colwellbacteria bacterium]MDD4818898.1 class I tRNA ligase family protein [Candidatus Colwellbacteria bacterium]
MPKINTNKKTVIKRKKPVPKEYPFSKVEKKWTPYWVQKKIYQPDIKKAKKPFYNLMMFPYPSAEGLHVGNMYAFTGSDIYGRFKRMLGNDILEPIGLDGFGIHSENYAIKKGVHPKTQARAAEKNFYRQLQMIGNGFAWENRLETYDPEYYKWTQWLFIQMFNNGLAYRKKSPVNWCPSCKTVLADEQVISGKCERCDSEVTKKDLEQWFFKITKYAPKLLRNLDKIDWSDKVKIAQRNWIGRSDGHKVNFMMTGNGLNKPIKATIFTTRADTMLGATFLVVAPESDIIEDLKPSISNWEEIEEYIWSVKNKPEAERVSENQEKTGIEIKGIKAVNPANGMEIPVWVSDYVLAGYGTGMIMAVPAYDERDLEFAERFNLPVVQTPLVPKEKIAKQVGGKKAVQYRLRDWLISRQRYWGPPIPLVYCEKCAEKVRKSKGKERQQYTAGERANPGWFAVSEKKLPVELPYVKNFRPKGMGESPLASVKAFYNTKCPKCGGQAKRETDVSDTFLDSSWYYLRYPSVGVKKEPFDKKITKKWLPVDMYLGGAEHSVLHLLYSRFVAMALKDMGYINFDEPFTKFRAHGLIIRDGTKMSKSKGNVVNPDEYIKKFGADALRLHLMFLGPIEEGGDFRDSGMVGITRFLGRVWSLGANFSGKGKDLSRHMHKTIKEVTEDLSELKYNTAISELMIAMNIFSDNPEAVTKKDLETFLILLAPLAPFITEELWEIIGNKPSIHNQKWPEYDKKALKQDSFNLVIQVNGKVRHTVKAARGLSEKDALEIALAEEKISSYIGGADIKKTFFVSDRLINIVI